MLERSMKRLLVFLLVLNSLNLFAQQNDFSSQITASFVSLNSPHEHKQKRRMMYREKEEKKKNNVLKSSFAGLMFLYQNVISEQISASCKYQISCSEYTKLQIEKNGLFIGALKGFHQLMHCTHGAMEEVPPYMKANYSSKILNSVE